MSVDSKMFVTCGKDKFVDVVDAVVKQLRVWSSVECWKNSTNATDYKLFRDGVRIHGYSLSSISLAFGCGGYDKRYLNVFSDCSCDYEDTFEGDKIIFSIGNWGKNHSIMNQVAIALSPFGDVYYDHNDCDDEGFVLVYDFAENSSQFKGENYEH
jgi:hypothetical protein